VQAAQDAVTIPADIAVLLLGAILAVFGWVVKLVIQLTVQVGQLGESSRDHSRRLENLEQHHGLGSLSP
jgi:hypothetical protein